jgi:hypothetical protein
MNYIYTLNSTNRFFPEDLIKENTFFESESQGNGFFGTCL